jgi:hypothetical protein
VGDVTTFWVHNTETENNEQIEAELVHVTPAAYAWVEQGQPYDRDLIVRSVDRFSANTYPALRNAFGSEWNPGVDGDPRLHILFNRAMGSSALGYYYSMDEYTAPVRPVSNEKEIFFINLDAVNGARSQRLLDSVLAHEFQHMIHWSEDRGEELWINEGLSNYAQEVAGLPASVPYVAIFAAQPDTQLNAWSGEPSETLPHYGAAQLLVTYLAERFGPEFLRRLVAEPADGARGVEQALAALGVDEEFPEIFADWVVANYADQPGALDSAGRYGYETYAVPPLAPAARHQQYPVEDSQGQAFNQATDYLVLEGAGDVTFRFQGAPETRLVATTPPAGRRFWLTPRADDANPRLTGQFDLAAFAPGTPVTMTVAMWHDIEENYDYGYVLASRDGSEWSMLAGQNTRTDDPVGNNLGAGYTGRSLDPLGAPGWRQEIFDLGDFAGGPLWLQFSYATDDGYNAPGWAIDDVVIPALGYAADFEGPADGWASEGWLLTDNALPQGWLLQVLEFDGDRLAAVRRIPVDAAGAAKFPVTGLGAGRTAVVAITALAPLTTEPAQYWYSIDEDD